CLGDAHDVVVLDRALAAEIAERDHAAAIGHQRDERPNDGGEGEGADLVREEEAGTGRLDEAPFEILLLGEGDRVDDEVDAPEVPRDVIGDLLDLLVPRHVARVERGFARQRREKLLDARLELLALVGEREPSSFARRRFRDRPGDGALVRDAENEAVLSFEEPVRHGALPSSVARVSGACGGDPNGRIPLDPRRAPIVESAVRLARFSLLACPTCLYSARFSRRQPLLAKGSLDARPDAGRVEPSLAIDLEGPRASSQWRGAP